MCSALLGKAVPKMTYIVSDGMLNPTHSLTLKNFLLLQTDPHKNVFPSPAVALDIPEGL